MFLQESLKTMHISFWKTDLNRNFFPKLHIIHVYTIFILDFLQFWIFIVSRPWGNMVMDSLPLFRFLDKLNPKEPNFKLFFLSDFKLLFSFCKMLILWFIYETIKKNKLFLECISFNCMYSIHVQMYLQFSQKKIWHKLIYVLEGWGLCIKLYKCKCTLFWM